MKIRPDTYTIIPAPPAQAAYLVFLVELADRGVVHAVALSAAGEPTEYLGSITTQNAAVVAQVWRRSIVIQDLFRQALTVWNPLAQTQATVAKTFPTGPSVYTGDAGSMSHTTVGDDDALYWIEVEYYPEDVDPPLPQGYHEYVLFRMDPETWNVTEVGRVGFDNVNGLGADAYEPSIKGSSAPGAFAIWSDSNGFASDLFLRVHNKSANPDQNQNRLVGVRDMDFVAGTGSTVVLAGATNFKAGPAFAVYKGFGTYWPSDSTAPGAPPYSLCVQFNADGTSTEAWPNQIRQGDGKVFLRSSYVADNGDYYACFTDTDAGTVFDGVAVIRFAPPYSTNATGELVIQGLKEFVQLGDMIVIAGIPVE